MPCGTTSLPSLATAPAKRFYSARTTYRLLSGMPPAPATITTDVILQMGGTCPDTLSGFNDPGIIEGECGNLSVLGAALGQISQMRQHDTDRAATTRGVSVGENDADPTRHPRGSEDNATKLFLEMMTACYERGEGCVLDLGPGHPFGRFGLVRHSWTEADMNAYETSRKPPLWIGRLPNTTLIVPLSFVTATVRSGDPPVAAVRRIGPYSSLVVVTDAAQGADPDEIKRWIIPSE